MSEPAADAGEIGGDDEVVGGPIQELPPLPEDAEAAKKAAGRDFPCARCGAALQFSPGEQKLRCPFCAHEQDVALDAEAKVAENDLREMLERIAARRRGGKPAGEGVHEVRCDACGANVQFRGALTATRCPYCAAPIHREGVHDAPERMPVDGVLPFQVAEPKARENLRTWIRKRWFLPGDLKRDGIQAGFTGVYLPFFTFDALTNNRYSGLRGIRHTRVTGSGKSRRVVVYYTWHPVAGRFQRFFDDVLENAGSGLPDDEMRELEPWPLAKLKPWSPEFLTGFLARTYEVELAECFTRAKRRIAEEIESDVRRRIGGDSQRVHSIETQWPALACKHVLLPVWLLSYRFREKPYRVVVNAATGEVQGERPWSVWKILGLILAIAAAGGLVALLVNR